ncbi:hypothetical protein [Saccharicrinis fermentans]|nr:hypothetical protein [Saccharicrinis fermentans]
MKFDKIYENRGNYGMIYRDIYDSGALERIKSFLFNHFDTTVTANKGYSSRKLLLSNTNDLTNDTTILSAAEYLMKKGFYRIELVYRDGERNELSLGQTFLKYKHAPTRHYLIFSEAFEYKYRYAQNNKWFFHSSDEEADEKVWIDSRPDWLMPYFEAFNFFKDNPDW